MRTTAAHKGHARTEGETRPHDVSRWRGQKWRTGGSDKGRFGDHHPVAGPVIALMPQESGRSAGHLLPAAAVTGVSGKMAPMPTYSSSNWARVAVTS